MFKPFNQEKNIPQTEEEVLKLWREKRTFYQSMDQNKDNEPFVFYEGPPTANGRPGIHHVMSRTFKDSVCRYQTMKGRYVVRKAGWDTHGLPVELQVEKALGLKSKAEIEQYGIAEFNRKCRESVWEHKEEWEKLTERMGYWTDLEHPYATYDTSYIQSVWWGMKQLSEKDLLYQAHKVVPYCTRCGTSLSLAEVAQGYKEVTESSIYAQFKLKEYTIEQSNDLPKYILAWTTTPWTLPGNVALAVGKSIDYSVVSTGEKVYILAQELLPKLQETNVLPAELTVIKTVKGAELVGLEYEPLFAGALKANDKAFKVYEADFVTTEDGTGVVHTAVMYGEDDYNLGLKVGLPTQHTVGEDGYFLESVPDLAGRPAKNQETEKQIIDHLKAHDNLLAVKPYKHDYPFCWRCSTALLYYARNSWFVRIDQSLRDRLVALNQTVKWVPDHIKDGRFGNWLAGLRDWAISRERYWGTPMPIWICQNDESHRQICASLDEIKALATEASKGKLTDDFDPHRPFIDDIELTCPDCSGVMKRVPEVVDVWLDSGMMPYAQWGYPLQNQEIFAQQFPADYISEGIDQTRGWFNTLLILSTVLFDKPAYKSVITQNLVLDEKGQKMSKSKGNVVNPWDIIDDTGIDALRFYFLVVNQPGENKNFSTKAVQEVYRKTVMIWWNVTNFFLTYAEVDKWQPGQEGQATVLDKWILARLNQATTEIDAAMSDLDLFTAARTLRDFIDELSTWYLRRSRKRRDNAFYATLHEVLLQTSQLAAPFMPFIAEATYQALKTPDMAESVHLTAFPAIKSVDHDQLDQMALVRSLVTLGHAARAQAKIKVRQPLAEARILAADSLKPELFEILADELNVKKVTESDELPTDWLVAERIALDPTLTPELEKEGQLRDLVREFQDLRKKSGCQPGQLVNFTYKTESQSLRDLLAESQEELLKEISGRSLTEMTEGQINDQTASIQLNNQSLELGLIHG